MLIIMCGCPGSGKSTFVDLLYAIDDDIYVINPSSWVPESIQEDDRQESIEFLLTELENFIKSMGYTYMFTSLQSKSLIKTHKKLGWFVDERPSYEVSKKVIL